MIYKEIIKTALPVIFANITVPLLGAVDIAMLGHTHNENLLAAIAIGAMIFDLLFWAFSFLRMTTTGLVAQSPNKPAIVLRALVLAFLFGLLLMIFQAPLLSLSLNFFSTTKTIMPYVTSYFKWRIFAAIPTLIGYVTTGYLFGRRNTKASLALVLFTNITAITLDFIFVFIYNAGIVGLALANVIAQSLAAFIALYYLHKTYAIFHQLSEQSIFSKKAFYRLLKVNTDVLIRSLSLLFTFSYFTRISSQLGATTVAANAILMNLNHLMAYTLDGFTIALESFIGQAIGERRLALFKQSFKACTITCIAGACLFSLLFALTGPILIGLMTSISKVRALCLSLLPWLIGLPLIAIGSFILDGCYIGAVWTKDMRNSMLIALAGFILCTHLFHSYAANGLWIAFYVFMLLRLVFLWLPLKKNIRAVNWSLK